MYAFLLKRNKCIQILSDSPQIVIDYERGKFEHAVSPSASEGIFLKVRAQHCDIVTSVAEPLQRVRLVDSC